MSRLRSPTIMAPDLTWEFFYSVPGLTTTKGLALAFQTNYPHANDFTLAILRLHENDFLNSLQRKWWGTNNECSQEQETSKEK